MTASIWNIDPEHPQPRVVEKAVSVLASGGLVAFPTDTYYAIGCDLFDKRAIERIYQLKQLPRTHELSFLCADLAEVARYAMLDNAAFRVLRRKTPGPFTFVLPATRLVPDLALSRQKTVGIRLPGNPVALEIVRKLAHPVISTSAATPDGEVLIDARDIRDQLGHGLELILDGGYQANEPSSVVDLTGPEPRVVRVGKGDVSDLLSGRVARCVPEWAARAGPRSVPRPPPRGEGALGEFRRGLRARRAPLPRRPDRRRSARLGVGDPGRGPGPSRAPPRARHLRAQPGPGPLRHPRPPSPSRGGAARPRGSHRRGGCSPGRPPAAPAALPGRGRPAPRGPRLGPQRHRGAGPRHAGAALCHRPSGVGARHARRESGQPRDAGASREGEGRQGAARAGRGSCHAGAAHLPRRRGARALASRAPEPGPLRHRPRSPDDSAGVLEAHRALRESRGHPPRHLAAQAPPLLRDAPARGRSRPSRRAGHAGARRRVHHRRSTPTSTAATPGACTQKHHPRA